MKKNIKTYKSFIYYEDNAGIGAESSKSNLLEKLRSFEGMVVDHAEIETGYTMRRESLAFYINIQNIIQDEGSDKRLMIESSYRFSFVRQWKLFQKEELIYEGEDFTKYEYSDKYQKLFNGAKLIKAEIDKDWKEATFKFENDLELKVYARYDELGLASFFIITKNPEPFIMLLNFAKTEEITYLNEILNSEVVKRENPLNEDYDFSEIQDIAIDQGLTGKK
jgi:hypothetical protein